MLSLSQQAALRGVQPRPPDWTKAFGRRAPLEVDLGCGRGDYAKQRSFSTPEINMVALDLRKKWIAQIRNWAQQMEQKNIRALRGDVSRDLPMLFPEKSVAVFTVYHPDPWWKKRHQKRRLINPSFLHLLADLLVPEGLIYLQTDVLDLAKDMEACFQQSEAFVSMNAAWVKSHRLGNTSSHREKKCRQLGIPLYALAYHLKQPRQP